MENILKKETVYFILLFRKFTNKLDFNPHILSQIVHKYLIKERITTITNSYNKTLTYWVSGNFKVLHSYNDQPSEIYKGIIDVWHKYGKLHRDNDLPARIHHKSGYKAWYKNGKLHRDNDLPAEIDNFNKKWYRNGKLHRDNDLPAVINIKHKKWYINGYLHRDNDKPAEIYDNGTKVWYRNGKLCRRRL